MRLIDADKIDTRARGNNSQRTMWLQIKWIVDAAPTVYEWISVEDGLPYCEQGAESEAVLFITKQGFMYTGYYGCGGIFHDRYFREFKNVTEGYDISNVTHWMPLPEPPTEKEN